MVTNSSDNDLMNQHHLKLRQILSKYLTPNAADYCALLIIRYKLHLHIEVERKDRLGDYSPHLGKGNRISINHNLNPYDFLITFIHELAHHTTWKKYGPKHQSHGDEWKEEFKFHMRPVVMNRFFPPDIETPLIKHMRRPHYTHTGDVNLMRALRKYDKKTDTVFLEDLDEGALFKTSPKGRLIFKKGEKRRTIYKCNSITNGKDYLVHGATSVYPVRLAENSK